ncbi:MAG: outer membrane lipoprotein-sorting protein [Chitinivibrionales bacterium]|nr:outer membrane lipoprotein-sorting protein [Chitinivibrionales bacterium]
MHLKALITVLTAASLSAAITVDEILDKVEANEEPQTSKAQVTQTVYQPDGSENVSKLITYGYNKGEKGLMEYISPARIKGMKILTLNDGDDIWFYSARTGRVRKIASHQKNQSVNNSDFSYEDLSSKDRREDYDAKLAGEEKREGTACYKLDMKAKTPDEVYSRIVMWVDKERYVPIEAHFYDEDGRLWKKMLMHEIEKEAGYWTPKRIEMKNVMKGSRTVMQMEKTEYDIELQESMFSERNLRR